MLQISRSEGVTSAMGHGWSQTWVSQVPMHVQIPKHQQFVLPCAKKKMGAQKKGGNCAKIALPSNTIAILRASKYALVSSRFWTSCRLHKPNQREKCGEDAGTRACGLAAQARVSCNTGLSCLSFSALAPIRDRAERMSVITAQRMLPLQQGRFHPISHILHTTTTCFLSASAS
jgi:hypothetical protein